MTTYRYDRDCERYLPVSGGASERLAEDHPPMSRCPSCDAVVETEYAKADGWKECLECDQWTCPDHQRPVNRDLPDIICTECKEWM